MRDDKTLAILKPIFDRHGVPEPVRLPLARFTEILIEEDLDNETIEGTLANGDLPWNHYDELLADFEMGNRRLRTWLTEKNDTLTLTRKGRALIQDLGRALPEVDAVAIADAMFGEAPVGAS
jgi:hypothetical protein